MDIVIKAKKARAAVASYLQAMMSAPTYLCICRKSDRPGKSARLERGMGFIVKGKIQARSRSSYRKGGRLEHEVVFIINKGRVEARAAVASYSQAAWSSQGCLDADTRDGQGAACARCTHQMQMIMKMKKMMKKTNRMMKRKMKNMMKMVMMQTAEMEKVQQVVQDAVARCRCGSTFHILRLTSRLHTLQINLGLGGDGIANVSTMTLLKI